MASRQDYLDYLAEQGYSEDEVLRMLDPAQADSGTSTAVGGVVGIMAGLIRDGNSKESAWALEILQSLNANTNYLLQNIINGRLKKRYLEAGIEHPEDIFPGVFPTNDFNARAVAKVPGLVLIDTACFELIEAGSWIYFSRDSIDSRNARIQSIVGDVICTRRLPPKSALDHPSLRGPESSPYKSLVTDVTTAAEEFVLAHEYAHFALGHYSQATEKSRSRLELDADRWAMESLLQETTLLADRRDGLITQIAGAMMFFGLAHLVEAAQKSAGVFESSDYPAAMERFSVIRELLRRFGLEEYCRHGEQIFATMAHRSDSLRPQ